MLGLEETNEEEEEECVPTHNKRKLNTGDQPLLFKKTNDQNWIKSSHYVKREVIYMKSPVEINSKFNKIKCTCDMKR